MKRMILPVLVGFALIPSFASAATLSQDQINAIVSILVAFGVDPNVVASVEADLAPSAPNTTISQVAPVIQNFGSVSTTTPVCDTTPIISVNFDSPSIQGWTANNGAKQTVHVVTNVTDSCGNSPTYNIFSGFRTIRKNVSGDTKFEISPAEVWDYDLSLDSNGTTFAGSYPIVITSGSVVSTSTLSVIQ